MSRQTSPDPKFGSAAGVFRPYQTPTDTTNNSRSAELNLHSVATTIPNINYNSNSTSSKENSESKLEPLSFRGSSGHNGSPVDDSKAEPCDEALPTSRELWGWFLYEVGISGYTMLLWIFFPLVIFSLFAASRSSGDTPNCPNESQDPRCLRVCDDLTHSLHIWDSNLNQSLTILEMSSESLQPAVVITAMLGVSIVLQLAVFCITSPLLDYGNMQNVLLGVGTGVGVAASILPINLYKASWWWVGALFFLVANIARGIASTSNERYLSSASRGIPVIRKLVFDRVQFIESVRTRFVNKISLTGATLGSLAGAVSILTACFIDRSPLHEYGPGLSLRFACGFGGLWWVIWTFISYSFLRDRPGPKFPGDRFSTFLVRKHLPGIIFSKSRNAETVRKRKNAFVVSAVCFLSSIGNATLFQSGVVCFSTKNFIKLALLAQLSSIAGNGLFFFVQEVFSRSNRSMLLAVLLVQLPLPIYGWIGFFTGRDSIGLKNEWEFAGFACLFGGSVGALRSYIRTLFLDYTSTSIAGAQFCLLNLVTQLSTFVGTVMVLIFLKFNVNLRYTFVSMEMALVIAIALAVRFIDVDAHGGAGTYGGMPDDDESLTPASLISGSVVLSSSQERSLGSNRHLSSTDAHIVVTQCWYSGSSDES